MITLTLGGASWIINRSISIFKVA